MPTPPVTTDTLDFARGWTPERKARFLDHLASKGNVRAACLRVGLSPEAAYRLRRRDDLFARAWALALAIARTRTEQVLADRAIDGVEEPIYYRGELKGSRRRYDARLLLAHLARLDKLVEQSGASEDFGRFDELLALIAGEQVPEGMAGENGALPLDRESYVERSTSEAKAHLRYLDAVDEEPGGRDEEDDDEGFGARNPSFAYDDGDDWDDDDFDDDFDDGEDDPAVAVGKEYFRLRNAAEAERDRAREQAEREWDAWRERACGAVDALCGYPGAPVAPGLPGQPLVAPAPVPLAPETPRVFPSLRTASTPSTSALARALAGPVTTFTPPPQPRRPGALRRRAKR